MITVPPHRTFPGRAEVEEDVWVREEIEGVLGDASGWTAGVPEHALSEAPK